MKCYVHPKEDAVAVCKTCEKGVCNNCAVILAGNIFCKTCVEAGKAKAPTAEVSLVAPTPRGIPSRTRFIIGGVGAIISGVSGLFMLFGSPISISWLLEYISLAAGNIASIATEILLAVGLILAGIGYLGIKRNYGSGMGTVSFAFSIVVTVLLFVSVALGIIVTSPERRYYYHGMHPLYYIYVIYAFITFILFGVMQILWGATHIGTRHYTGHSGRAMATGIMLIISGALTVSGFISFAGIVLFFMSEILALIVFLTSSIPTT